jgi:arsenite methyltransferase
MRKEPTMATCCSSEETLREAVRRRYARVAEGETPAAADQMASAVGYDERERRAVPEGANLGLGCGNPGALAALRPGETVLDLGSGAGFDAFLAAAAVGPAGRVIGVDMTPEMVAKAGDNARKAGIGNAVFRLGTIEDLPVEDEAVDVVISNCVINLSPDKPRVFREAFRVLRPGGRLLVSDIVLGMPLPERVRASVEAYVGCIAGAALRSDYLRTIADAGFADVEVVGETDASALLSGAQSCDPLVAAVFAAFGDAEELRRHLASTTSIKVSARKPMRTP